jgi:hypothetical protein
VFGKRTLEGCLEQLGKELLDSPTVKAVMMSKYDNGDVIVTLVEGVEESHKVKFGRVDHRSRSLIRLPATRAARSENQAGVQGV